MTNDPPPRLNFQLTPLTGDGFPVQQNEDFTLLLDQAVAGGSGTGHYLDEMLKFANLATYLNSKGAAAYTLNAGPNGTQEATATDGTTTLNVNLQLNSLNTNATGTAPPIEGLATVQMALPDPERIIKFAQFGISLAELPAGLVLTQQLWQALFAPILQRISTYVQSSIESWLEIDVGSDVSELGDAVAETAGEVAADVSEETAEVLVEEAVVAELAIDFSVAIPAFAALGVLLAVPLLISALDKTFVLHIEVDNLTNNDFTWSIPYMEEGTMTSQPASTLIPKMGMATDMWGDQSSVAVVYQAYYSSMNTSGFEGIGLVMNLSPAGYTDQDIAAVISIPWISDNGIWLGDSGNNPDWQSLYNSHSGSSGSLTATHGNQRFYTTLAIDALSGNNDEYHCVIRIEPL
jgi:hypothetical protein